MNRYWTKRGDLPGVIRGTCQQGADPVDISEASQVRLLMERRSDGTPVSIVVTNLDDGTVEKRGRWEHTWSEGDLADVGVYDAEVEVRWPNGDVMSFPKPGYNEVIVEPDLG